MIQQTSIDEKDQRMGIKLLGAFVASLGAFTASSAAIAASYQGTVSSVTPDNG